MVYSDFDVLGAILLMIVGGFIYESYLSIKGFNKVKIKRKTHIKKDEENSLLKAKQSYFYTLDDDVPIEAVLFKCLKSTQSTISNMNESDISGKIIKKGHYKFTLKMDIIVEDIE